eukprot:365617-Chlamydomonas_euryale.AAC.14
MEPERLRAPLLGGEFRRQMGGADAGGRRAARGEGGGVECAGGLDRADCARVPGHRRQTRALARGEPVAPDRTCAMGLWAEGKTSSGHQPPTPCMESTHACARTALHTHSHAFVATQWTHMLLPAQPMLLLTAGWDNAAANGPGISPQPCLSTPQGDYPGRLWFSWLSRFMATGAARQLQPDDLLRLDDEMQPRMCSDALWEAWMQVWGSCS